MEWFGQHAGPRPRAGGRSGIRGRIRPDSTTGLVLRATGKTPSDELP